MKRIEIDDEFYRMRKKRLVRIPKQWLDQVPHSQTIRKRQSKKTGKIKRYMQACKRCSKHSLPDYYKQKYAMLDGDK